MKNLKRIALMLFVLAVSACSSDDNGSVYTGNTPTAQNVGGDATPETAQGTDSSEEQETQPATSQDSTDTENATPAKHYYELSFSGGPLNGTTLADSVAIESGLAIYSDDEGPEVVNITISKGDVFLNGLLTRFDGTDSFPLIDDNQIQEQSAANLVFSFVPPGPSITGYISKTGTLELSNFEIYTLQGLELASLTITFEGNFVYAAPPNEDEMVSISGSITIEQYTFKLPDFDFPDQTSIALGPKPESKPI